MLWKWFTFDSGFMSYVLGAFGVEPENWLNEYPWTFVIFANGFVGASMGMIIFASAVLAIPGDVLRAAEVDGAYPWATDTAHHPADDGLADPLRDLLPDPEPFDVVRIHSVADWTAAPGSSPPRPGR